MLVDRKTWGGVDGDETGDLWQVESYVAELGKVCL
jgi:hypothetical protein